VNIVFVGYDMITDNGCRSSCMRSILCMSNHKDDIFQQTSEVTKKEHLHSIKFSACLHSYWNEYLISVLKIIIC